MSNAKRLATAETKKIPNKSRPGAEHGFQVCRVIDADGCYQKVEQYFDPAKAPFFLEPGEYEIHAGAPKVVKDRLVIFPEFVRVSKAVKS